MKLTIRELEADEHPRWGTPNDQADGHSGPGVAEPGQPPSRPSAWGRQPEDIWTLATEAFDQEPLGGAALVDLLRNRPVETAISSLGATSFETGRLVGLAFVSLVRGQAYLDGLAVGAGARDQGVATALMDEIESWVMRQGYSSLKIGGNTWHYAWPGVDTNYLAAQSLFVKLGYQQTGTIQNMEVDLAGAAPPEEQHFESDLGPILVRRGRIEDVSALEDFALKEFTAEWAYESVLALTADRPRTHLALTAGGGVVGFASHGMYRPDQFGPLAVAQRVRGTGLGAALLQNCLGDLAAVGLRRAEIAWVGPADFYARAVGARLGRTFTTHEKAL